MMRGCRWLYSLGIEAEPEGSALRVNRTLPIHPWGRAFRPAHLITEEKDQVDAPVLDAALGQAVGDAARFRRQPGLETQELRELVFQHELGEAALAELLTEAHERHVADLLAHRQAACRLAGHFVRGRDLEEVDIERLADRLSQL